MSQKGNNNVSPKLPAWKQALMESKALTASLDEKGYMKDYLDGIYYEGRNKMMKGGRFYEMFTAYEKMNELQNHHAYAVDSSSMLAYNFFHWISPDHPFVYSDGRRYDKVYFEVAMCTLKTSKNAPAKMDVVLVSDDCRSMLCFESKLSEYFDSWNATEEFSPSYIDSTRYYNNYFREDFIKYVSSLERKCSGYFVCDYGIKQNICHLIAITNLHQSNYAVVDFFDKNRFIEPEVAQKMQEHSLDIRFANILYLIDDKHTLDYINRLNGLLSSKTFNPNLWRFFVQPIFVNNYSNMLAIMRGQMPDSLYDYLIIRYPMLHTQSTDACQFYTM